MKQETIDQVLKFRDDRNWRQFHNPKDLAISICPVASEPVKPYFTRLLRVLTFCLGMSKSVVKGRINEI